LIGEVERHHRFVVELARALPAILDDLSALQFRCLTIKAANVPAAGRKFLAATMCL
jgi:hypothetical protein